MSAIHDFFFCFRRRQFLAPETFVAREFLFADLHVRGLEVDLIADNQLLAFVKVCFVGGCADEEAAVVNLRRGLGLLLLTPRVHAEEVVWVDVEKTKGVERGAPLLLLLLLLPLLLLCGGGFYYFDGDAVGSEFFAVDGTGGGADGEGTFSVGGEGIGQRTLS